MGTATEATVHGNSFFCDPALLTLRLNLIFDKFGVLGLFL